MSNISLKDTKPFEIGWKALACSISDIAAMGGEPRYCLVSLGLPRGLDSKFVESIYKGIKKLAGIFKINIVGGDTNTSDKIIIDVFLAGEARIHDVIYRSNARSGDVIAVTGSLGNSYLSKKHLVFMPRLTEAQFLTRNFKINSMIDISDGLSSDLNHILEKSRKGALIFEENIPLVKGARLENALNDGEDFELLFTLSRNEALRLAKKTEKLPFSISFIGFILNRPKKLIIKNKSGGFMTVKPEGFRHF
ncbi:MAG: thiamine-phosphate kinase [Candidatus Omnitrophica bacterium]|nr:thiamine-phosphate kinase [Candidatus Omnitrophota bacterium]